MDIVVLAIAFGVILAGAELFTNGIEWFGRKLDLAQGAVGSVLAAVGTALPETMIPIIAIVFGGGGEATDDVGVGAILGAPFMLSTLAMFVTGVGVIYWRGRRATGTRMVVDTTVLVHDIRYFVVAYALAIATAFLPPELSGLRFVVAVVLIGIYAWYVKGHFDAEAEEHQDELAPLRFHRVDRRGVRNDPATPRLRVVGLQVLFALACIIGGAFLFVGAVDRLALALGVSEILLALVIAPIATELPEKFNSLIWVRQGKDTLAMGNITGAMVFQSAIPTVVALVLAGEAWHVNEDSLIAFLSAGIAFIAVAAIFGPMWRRGRLDGRSLLVGGALYLVYLAIVGPRHRGRAAVRLSRGRHGGRESPDGRLGGSRGRRGATPHVTWSRPMLTQQPSDTAAEAAPAAARSVDDLIAYFEGEYVPLRDARVSIMTHAFMYGTATFEGIRGYWNAEQETLYVLFLREHLGRIRNSAKMLLMDDLPSVDELVEIVLETVRRNHYREDVYIRPSFYKSTRAIGVRLHHLDHELYVITSPFGNYIDIDKGVRVMTSTWRRNADEALPARGKIVGGYVNMAFQKSEAELNGFDEALVMTPDGHASEASAANLFMVRDGVLDHAAGLGRHPRGRDPQGDPDPRLGPWDPDGGPLGGSLRALRLRRGLPVRDGRAGQSGHRARPSCRGDRRDRPGQPPRQRAVLQGRPWQ